MERHLKRLRASATASPEGALQESLSPRESRKTVGKLEVSPFYTVIQSKPHIIQPKTSECVRVKEETSPNSESSSETRAAVDPAGQGGEGVYGPVSVPRGAW